MEDSKELSPEQIGVFKDYLKESESEFFDGLLKYFEKDEDKLEICLKEIMEVTKRDTEDMKALFEKKGTGPSITQMCSDNGIILATAKSIMKKLMEEIEQIMNGSNTSNSSESYPNRETFIKKDTFSAQYAKYFDVDIKKVQEEDQKEQEDQEDETLDGLKFKFSKEKTEIFGRLFFEHYLDGILFKKLYAESNFEKDKGGTQFKEKFDKVYKEGIIN